MPELAPASKSRLHDSAAAAVADWIVTLPGDARRLTAHELNSYRSVDAAVGWRLTIQFKDRVRRLDLLLGKDFPRREPTIVLVDRPPYLTWPHIDRAGVMCILHNNATVAVSSPVEICTAVLHLACDLIGELASGSRINDFRDEFDSYWTSALDISRRPVVSLLLPVGPTRLIWTFVGTEEVVVADDDATLRKWLRNSYRRSGKLEPQPGLLLWLDQALLPREYPTSAADLKRLAVQQNAGALLNQLSAELLGAVAVVIGAPTANGPSLAGLTIPSSERIERVGDALAAVVPGFRPGRVPKSLLVRRRLAANRLEKHYVNRADASWIHGRDQDRRVPRLLNSDIAIVGCGSVGAAVAMQLASAGVGGMTLFDHESLTWANVGRHPLGAASVGQYKAKALAAMLRSHFPHMRDVHEVKSKWQKAGTDDVRRLAGAELVIGATGDWSAEGHLNEWSLANRSGPTIYGWTEPFAVAGHAVAIFPKAGCFQCGLTHAGSPKLKVSRWPAGATTRQEPACGVVYQPYGNIELGHIVSLVAETVIDCLIGEITASTHRIWAARDRMLVAAGGEWTDEWLKVANGRTGGGFLEELAWQKDPTCIGCRTAN